MITAIYHIMIGIVNKLFSSIGGNPFKKYNKIIEKINKFEESISTLSD